MVVRGTYVFWGSASGCDRQEVLKYPVRMFGEQYATGTHSPSMAQVFLFRTSCPEIAGFRTGY